MDWILPDGMGLSWQNAERLLQIGVGLFYVYSALSGIFQWQKIPPQAARFEKFIQALYATGYLMPLVKFTELIAGALLVLGWTPMLATLLLAPIVFVIVSAHFVLNLYLGWRIALVVGVPFLLLILCQIDRWRFLWNS